ncbi:protein of unknown function [Cyanobium sp. NIES-981]|nr:protein of unknown function [Cyanobium sp. NIES-981]
MAPLCQGTGAAMVAQPRRPRVSMPPSPPPSPVVVKLQIIAAVFLPMALLAVWLRSQGF